MKRIFKYLIILTLIIIIGIFLRPIHYARIYDDTSRNIYWMLSLYIRENNGQYLAASIYYQKIYDVLVNNYDDKVNAEYYYKKARECQSRR